jgi:hypothetical protein
MLGAIGIFPIRPCLSFACGARAVWRLGLAMLLLMMAWPALASEVNPLSPMLTLRMGDQVVELDVEQVRALPQHQVRTSTAC